MRLSIIYTSIQVAEAARLRTLEQEQGTLMDGQGGGGGVGEGGGGVREGEYGNSSGHSLHSDGMVSCTVTLLTWQLSQSYLFLVGGMGGWFTKKYKIVKLVNKNSTVIL